jgi:hypothetical protein
MQWIEVGCAGCSTTTAHGRIYPGARTGLCNACLDGAREALLAAWSAAPSSPLQHAARVCDGCEAPVDATGSTRVGATVVCAACVDRFTLDQRAWERHAAEVAASRRDTPCLRCGGPAPLGSWSGLCRSCLHRSDSFEVLEAVPPVHACAWCGEQRSDLVGPPGEGICDACIEEGIAVGHFAEQAPPSETSGCSFCGHQAVGSTEMLMGPGVCICSACTAHALATRADDPPPAPGWYGRAQCSFCGKAAAECRRFCIGDGVNICDLCLDLCGDVLAERDTARASRLTVVEPVLCAFCGTMRVGLPHNEFVHGAGGPTVCTQCLNGCREASSTSPRVGHWCARCRVPSERAGRLFHGARYTLCERCIEWERRMD